MKILKFAILIITTLLEVTMVFGSAFFINSGAYYIEESFDVTSASILLPLYMSIYSGVIVILTVWNFNWYYSIWDSYMKKNHPLKP